MATISIKFPGTAAATFVDSASAAKSAVDALKDSRPSVANTKVKGLLKSPMMVDCKLLDYS